MTGSRVVELTNISLKSDRGEQIFDDLNLVIEAGHSATISGGAAAGKTTLVELMSGIRLPHSGSVELFGECISTGRKHMLKAVRRRIGGVGGIFKLMPSYTVAQNVAFPLILTKERAKVRRERLLHTLTEFSLLKQASEFPDRLTRVEYTLAMFARASIANQPLLIVDEPSAGLDPKTMDWIFEHMVKISLSGRSLLILSSESLSKDIPNTESYRIEGGKLV